MRSHNPSTHLGAASVRFGTSVAKSGAAPPRVRSADDLLPHFLRAIAWCLLGSVLLTALLRFSGVNLFRFQQMWIPRTCAVFAMYLYLIAATVGLRTPAHCLYLLPIPFLTQFYQTVLGREFEAGALSLMRLLPLLVLAGQLLLLHLTRPYRASGGEWILFLGLSAVSFIGWAIGASLSPVGVVNVFFLSVLVPLFYCYIGNLMKDRERGAEQLVLALAICTYGLLIGFVITVLFGLNVDIVDEAGTLAGTRSLGDFNSLFPYLVLLWPFAFLYARHRHPLLIVLLFGLMTASVMLGLSRTSAVLGPILLLPSLASYARSKPRQCGIVLGVLCVSMLALSGFERVEELLATWSRRFDINVMAEGQVSLAEILSVIAPDSKASLGRAVLREEALEIFWTRPEFGRGWGSYLELSPSEFPSAHSMIHDWLAETGVFGVSVLLLLLGIGGMNVSHRLFAQRASDEAFSFFLAFGVWFVSMHTLGGNLFVASVYGFTVNAINGLLLTLYVRRDVLRALT